MTITPEEYGKMGTSVTMMRGFVGMLDECQTPPEEQRILREIMERCHTVAAIALYVSDRINAESDKPSTTTGETPCETGSSRSELSASGTGNTRSVPPSNTTPGGGTAN